MIGMGSRITVSEDVLEYKADIIMACEVQLILRHEGSVLFLHETEPCHVGILLGMTRTSPLFPPDFLAEHRVFVSLL